MTLPFAQLSFPEIYEQALVGPLFQPFAESIVDDLGLAAGERVLDVACGTGIVARLAKDRVGKSGKVAGVDLSPAMIAVAQRVAPEIDWREGDACALPLHDGEEFDVVVCHQGIQFVPDKPLAVQQMRRALAADGRLAIGTWRPDSEIPLGLELRRVAERHVGPIADHRHSFGEAGPLEELLRAGGFQDVRSKVVSRTVRFNDGPVFVRLNAMALVGMSAAAKDMTDEERQRVVGAIVADSADAIRPCTTDSGLAYELSTNVATARR